MSWRKFPRELVVELELSTRPSVTLVEWLRKSFSHFPVAVERAHRLYWFVQIDVLSYPNGALDLSSLHAPPTWDAFAERLARAIWLGITPTRACPDCGGRRELLRSEIANEIREVCEHCEWPGPHEAFAPPTLVQLHEMTCLPEWTQPSIDHQRVHTDSTM
ncbi:MAG: hypothetical protein ACO1OB_13410 [Archangium sp.]